MIKALTDEMNFHKKEVQLLKSEKETLQAVLTMKTADVKDSLQNELKKIEDAMKRHFAHQKVKILTLILYILIGNVGKYLLLPQGAQKEETLITEIWCVFKSIPVK